MCDNCHYHGSVMGTQEDARKSFLSAIANASSQVSDMQAGIIAKDFKDRMEVAAFGSVPDILNISSRIYLGYLKIALDKAKTEKDLLMIAGLYDQLSDTAIQISGFVDELSTTADEIKASLKEG